MCSFKTGMCKSLSLSLQFQGYLRTCSSTRKSASLSSLWNALLFFSQVNFILHYYSDFNHCFWSQNSDLILASTTYLTPLFVSREMEGKLRILIIWIFFEFKSSFSLYALIRLWSVFYYFYLFWFVNFWFGFYIIFEALQKLASIERYRCFMYMR